MKESDGCVVASIGCLVLLGILLLFELLLAWLTVFVAAAFGYDINIWVALAIWFLLGVFVNMIRKKDG